MVLANAIPSENEKRLLHAYLLKLPFKKASMSKCLSINPALFGLRMSFPIEKRHSTTALDGKAVLYLMNNCCSFSCDANEAKIFLAWSSSKYDLAIFVALPF